MRIILIYLLEIYQQLLSPLIHRLFGGLMVCRFTPTCSEYAKKAIKEFGVIGGFGLSFKRITRCHPFSAGGYDPVPERQNI